LQPQALVRATLRPQVLALLPVGVKPLNRIRRRAPAAGPLRADPTERGTGY